MATEVGDKRGPHASAPGSTALVTKKARADQGALIRATGEGGALITTGPPRTSALTEPIMLLTGHAGATMSVDFSPSGYALASAGHDKSVLLWNVYGDCINYGTLKGHKNAVLEVRWLHDEGHILSVSADKRGILWDPHAVAEVRQFTEHTAVVNTCSVTREGEHVLVTGSDDGSARLWDVRQRAATAVLDAKFPVCAVEMTKDGGQVFTGSIDNMVKVWDARKLEEAHMMEGHTDTVVGMRLSFDGNYLVTNARDSSVRLWDVRPFAPRGRLLKTFQGARHSFENHLIRPGWSHDGRMVCCGSADRCVYVWDVATCRVLYRLPGHKGPTTQVTFHPTEPIIASCGMGGQVYLGEIDPKP